jgi:hypothetical protein
MCTLITSKGTDIDENIANQNHAYPYTETGVSIKNIFGVDNFWGTTADHKKQKYFLIGLIIKF